MKNLPLNCDFPATDLEDQLDRRVMRTRDARLVTPPSSQVKGVSDSSQDMHHCVAYNCQRFIDIRNSFQRFRIVFLGFVNLFMITVLALMWLIDLVFSGQALVAMATFFVPVWIVFFLLEMLLPLTLPVRFDRLGRFVYFSYRGSVYRIPWDDLELAFSYNWQYLGSGVMWERQYYSHIYLRKKYFFCGKEPRREILRLKFSSYFKEDQLYQNWNFIVRIYENDLESQDEKNLRGSSYSSYLGSIKGQSSKVTLFDHIVFFIAMPAFIWWKYSPFKYKWPPEVEGIFGKNNHY